MSVEVRLRMGALQRVIRNERMREVLHEAAREMDNAITADGGAARTDSELTSRWVRAAVIAGYEPGATLENTRDQLLRAIGDDAP